MQVVELQSEAAKLGLNEKMMTARIGVNGDKRLRLFNLGDGCEIGFGDFCYKSIAKIPKPDFTSIPQVEKPTSLATIFPNPGSHHFLIQTELIRFTLQLYDLQGQLLLTQQNRKEVDTEKLPSGCYIYRIIAENGMATSGKWVKK